VGVDWDAAGNAFVSAASVDHIWHVAPGGSTSARAASRRSLHVRIAQADKQGPPPPPHGPYGGINVYQGNLFPDDTAAPSSWATSMAIVSIHDQLAPDARQFFRQSDMRKKTDTGKWLEANDAVPSRQRAGRPRRRLWIMDWYDRYPCYQNAHAPDLDRERADLARSSIPATTKAKTFPSIHRDLSKLDDGKLVELLFASKHLAAPPSPASHERAQNQAERCAPRSSSKWQIAGISPGALWTLHSSANLTDETSKPFD